MVVIEAPSKPFHVVAVSKSIGKFCEFIEVVTIKKALIERSKHFFIVKNKGQIYEVLVRKKNSILFKRTSI